MIRELYLEFPNVFVCAINWWQVANAKDFFDEPGDHAGELETAAMLHIAPNLVLPLETAGNGTEKKFKIKALQEGWVSAQRQWTQISSDTGVGNPKRATKEKGKAFLEAVIQKVAEFFEELHHADMAVVIGLGLEDAGNALGMGYGGGQRQNGGKRQFFHGDSPSPGIV